MRLQFVIDVGLSESGMSIDVKERRADGLHGLFNGSAGGTAFDPSWFLDQGSKAVKDRVIEEMRRQKALKEPGASST